METARLVGGAFSRELAGQLTSLLARSSGLLTGYVTVHHVCFMQGKIEVHVVRKDCTYVLWKYKWKYTGWLGAQKNIINTNDELLTRASHWTNYFIVNYGVDQIDASVQYIPRNMHTVFALLCFVVVIHWLIIPYPSGLLHWHCGNLTIAPVPAKQPWWIWINTSCEFIMNDCITTTKQSTTKPCAYFLGYTVIADRTVSLETSSSVI